MERNELSVTLSLVGVCVRFCLGIHGFVYFISACEHGCVYYCVSVCVYVCVHVYVPALAYRTCCEVDRACRV